jgi:membrane glycosyltransferase
MDSLEGRTAADTIATASGTAPQTRLSAHLRPVASLASMPEPAPLDMPEQSLRRYTAETFPEGRTRSHRGTRWARLFVFGGALLVTVYGAVEMFGVINVGAITWLKWALLVLFVINFSWIALAFTNALAGFAILLRHGGAQKHEPVVLREKTAILLPVYNEDPTRPFAALAAMIEDMAATEHADHFDWFIISDTTNPDVWIAEEKLYFTLKETAPAGTNIYYRRRPRNTGRKAGNVADFVTGWGGAYAHFLVMDADSIMTASTMLQLTAAIEADPQAGIVQTVPIMINRNTLFARLQQFAGRYYGPVIATGLAAWSGRSANFWGHNAILRTKAFADHCGLPVLKGKPPFGGHILSHDFVEAALIRRAGYSVIMLPNLGGSYEESPPSLIDVGIRDRRWCQGNLQHLRVLGARGLRLGSRQHLISGIMSYVASPIWLAQLIVGILLVLQSHYIRPEYFTDEFALLPAFPRFDAERALALLGTTMAVLLTPKVLGIILALKDTAVRKAAGGGFRLIISALLETLFSALIAPIMMVIQTGSIFKILTGVDSGWNPQAREDGSIPMRDIVRKHYMHVLLGLFTLLAALLISTSLAAWMSPTIAGLILAVFLSWFSAQRSAGLWFRRHKLLLIPEENEPPAAATRARELRTQFDAVPGLHTGSLASVHGDVGFREAHAAMLPEAPHRERGSVTPARAVAIAKLNDASNVTEAASWLTPAERNEVLGDRALLELLARLEPETAPAQSS